MKKTLFLMVVVLAAVGCCKQEATIIGAWETQTPCGNKQVMVLEDNGVAKLCPNKCLKLETWTKAEDKLILSGQRFCKEDSAMVAFTDSMSIVKLTADSLQLTTSCGKTLNYVRLACDKEQCKDKKACCKDEKTCCKDEQGCCKDKKAEEGKCCGEHKPCCKEKGQTTCEKATCAEKKECCDEKIECSKNK